MVLEKQDSGISLATTGTTDSEKQSSLSSDLGDLKDLDDIEVFTGVYKDLNDVFLDEYYDEDTPVAAHRKVCCSLCRYVDYH